MTSGKTPLRYSYSQIGSDTNKGPIIKVGINNCYREDYYTEDYFIVDTASDLTIIKKQMFIDLELIMAAEYNDVRIEGVGSKPDDKPLILKVTFLDIEIPRFDISERIKAGIDMSNTLNLLGRDFLNSICMHLNGPDLEILVYG